MVRSVIETVLLEAHFFCRLLLLGSSPSNSNEGSATTGMAEMAADPSSMQSECKIFINPQSFPLMNWVSCCDRLVVRDTVEQLSSRGGVCHWGDVDGLFWGVPARIRGLVMIHWSLFSANDQHEQKDKN